MEIASLRSALGYAQVYARLVSELEQIEEAMKQFAESNPELVAPRRGMTLGPLVIGYEHVPASVTAPSESIGWLMDQQGGIFVFSRPAVDKPTLKRKLEHASEEIIARFRQHGIVYVSAYERFFARLEHAKKC